MSTEGPASRRWRSKLKIGFSSPLLFVLIGLKLGGVIHWSWWAVFAPLWIPALALFAIGLPLAAMALSSRIGDWRQDRRYRRLDRPPPWIGTSTPDSLSR